MNIKSIEPKELIIAESAILQTLSQIENEAKELRSLKERELKENQAKVIANYIAAVRDFAYLNRVRLANAQILIHIHKSMNVEDIDFQNIMTQKYENLTAKNR